MKIFSLCTVNDICDLNSIVTFINWTRLYVYNIDGGMENPNINSKRHYRVRHVEMEFIVLLLIK